MIFYFSGTGNTRWAAKEVARKTGDELAYIPDIINGDCRFKLGSGERLGFIFPVHGWRPPKLIRTFIEKVLFSVSDDDNMPYVYALCTAGDSIGKAIEIFDCDLKKKGLKLDAAFSLIMPESYVGLPFMDVDPKEREQRKISTAAKRLSEFESYIYNKEKTWHADGVDDRQFLVRGPLPAFFSNVVGGFFVNHLITDKPFHVAEKRCTGCGTCGKVCPVGDISMVNASSGKLIPSWKHDNSCLTCFTCYHHCPTHAIEYGGRTKSKGQYYFKPSKQRE